MKVAVVPGLYFKSYSRFAESRIPFEALALCSAITSVDGCSVAVVDFNAKSETVRDGDNSARFPALSYDKDFYSQAAREIAATDAMLHLFPISIHTNGNLFHSLRIARELRTLQPDSAILFSGLGPSSRHLDLMSAYPFVDAVLRGEPEATLIDVLGHAGTSHPTGSSFNHRFRKALSGIAGVTFRDTDDQVRTNPERALIQNLDDLPMPNLGLYGHVIGEMTSQTKDASNLSVEEHIHLEAGRGCPFSCTFCSNTYLWRRRYRLKSPGRLVDEIRYASEAFGARKFLLHQQAFTVNKHKTLAFCDALIEADLNVEWSCFTRTDCVTAELLTKMRLSGCNTIMFGIESGSQRIQDIIRKKANVERINEQIALTIAHGIKPQLSFIVGFPEETPDELQATFDMYCAYKFMDGVESQIGLLVPAGGTRVLDDNDAGLAFDGVQTTTWYTRFFDDESFAEMASQPMVFPQNHYIPNTTSSRELLTFIKVFDICASYLRRSCKYVIDSGLAIVPFGLYEDYWRWRSGKASAELDAPQWNGKLTWDTDLMTIVTDFAQFLRECVAGRDERPEILSALVCYELAVATVNQRVRERAWDEVCASAPAAASEYAEDREDPPSKTVDLDVAVHELFDRIDRNQPLGTKEATPIRYVIRAASDSMIAIEAITADGALMRHEQSFRQVEF